MTGAFFLFIDLKCGIMYNNYVYDQNEERGKTLMKKRLLCVIFSVMLSIALCLCLSACGGSDEDQANDSDQVKSEQEEEEDLEEKAEMEEKEEAMIEAEENAEESPIQRDKKYEDFVGSWETITDLADENFGGYKITFNKDKTFDAVITGEEESGKCVCEEGITTAQNEVVKDQFWFNDEGIMVVCNEYGAMAMLKKIK